MRCASAAGLLALLGMLGQAVPSPAQDLVERVRAATGAKPKPAPKSPAKSKAKSKPRAKPRPKPKPKSVARKPATKSPSKTTSKTSKPAAKKSRAPAAPAASPPPEPSPPPAAASAPSAPDSPAAPPPEASPAPAPAVAPSNAPAGAETAPPAQATPDAASGADTKAPVPAAVEAPGALSPAEPDGAAALQLALFVDAYASWQSSGPGTLATLSNHRAFSGQGSTLRAENGFGLAFLGLDASYSTEHVGVTANLRLGEGAPVYHLQPNGESDAAFGVELLTQAYVTWHPWQALTLDLGMFNTPFGAEVLESWKNLNYTHGALFYYGQPGWHSGLRLQWDASERLALVGLVANGSNLISETQQDAGLSQAPTLGAQIGWLPSEAVWLAAGGLFTTDGYGNDDAGFDALGDVIVRLEQGPLQLVLNADYVLTRNGAPDGSDRHFFGVSAAAGYAFSELLGVAARGEWLLDDASHDDSERERWRLFTVTLTADVRPLAAAPYLILRWDNRWEESNQQVFGKDARGTATPDDDSYADVWFQSVLGVVVTTAP